VACGYYTKKKFKMVDGKLLGQKGKKEIVNNMKTSKIR